MAALAFPPDFLARRRDYLARLQMPVHRRVPLAGDVRPNGGEVVEAGENPAVSAKRALLALEVGHLVDALLPHVPTLPAPPNLAARMRAHVIGGQAAVEVGGEEAVGDLSLPRMTAASPPPDLPDDRAQNVRRREVAVSLAVPLVKQIAAAEGLAPVFQHHTKKAALAVVSRPLHRCLAAPDSFRRRLGLPALRILVDRLRLGGDALEGPQPVAYLPGGGEHVTNLVVPSRIFRKFADA